MESKTPGPTGGPLRTPFKTCVQGSEAYQCTSDGRERAMNAASPFVSGCEATEAIEPGERT